MDELVEVAELSAMLAGPGPPPTLLDVRWRPGAGEPGSVTYGRGHLPRAVYVDLDRDLAGAPGPRGRHPLPDPDRFAAAMRAAGVRASTPVIVYDGDDASAAARAWWCLRYFGHPRVAVLDGGYAAWRRAGHEASAIEPGPRAGDFAPGPAAMPVLDAAGAARMARNGVLLDARSPERYRGEHEPMDPVAGHIPGAISAPTAENTGPDGCFRPPEQLRERFTAAGVGTGRGTAVYCGSGVTAAHQVLALQRAGHTAALYVGSWSDWITDPSRPVARGARPG